MIIPAILPKSEADLRKQIALLDFADYLQIDVVDGKFDDDISWPYNSLGKIIDIKDIFTAHTIEVDLMVINPLIAARQWLEAGAKTLVVHLESTESPEAVLELKKEFDFLLGYAVNSDTPLDTLHPFVPSADFVQLMGIKEIGKQGQPFDSSVLERIATLRSMYPYLEISIDGAVGPDTLLSLKKAGANRFVVGSAILRSEHPQAMFSHLLKISE